MSSPAIDSIVSEPSLRVWRIVSVPFDENTYVFAAGDSTDCVVLDPGLQPAAIVKLLEDEGLTPAAIICTHGHSDHIAGNSAMKERWPEAPLVIGKGDAPKLRDPVQNLSAMFGFEVLSPEADNTLVEGNEYEAAGFVWRVLETPGHCAGHITLLIDVDGKTHAVAGDVLFQRGVGRSDFPDGDPEALRASIHDKLFPLPDDTVVYPGHGPTTTIGEERRENPYVGAVAGYSQLADR